MGTCNFLGELISPSTGVGNFPYGFGRKYGPFNGLSYLEGHSAQTFLVFA